MTALLGGHVDVISSDDITVWGQREKVRPLLGFSERRTARFPDVPTLREVGQDTKFLTTDFRGGETRFWSGWCGHRLRRRHVRYEIEVRQVNLIDRDQNLRNPSAIL